PAPPPKPSLHLNWEDWLIDLEDSDACLDDKRQLIETLWTIMTAFVDLGWDVSPAHATETCGQQLDLKVVLTAAVLNLKEQQKEEL
ncbi:MAG: hypothetical protein AAFY84_18485, partial [Pseudomonadota bacterium]